MSSRPRTPDITGAFLVVLVLVAAVAWTGWQRVQQLQQEIEALTEEYVQKVDSVHRMRSLVRERMLRAALVISAQDRVLQDRYHREFRELAEYFVMARAEVEALVGGPDEVTLMEDLRELTGEGAPILSEIVDLALVGGRNDAIARLYSEAMPVQEQVLAQMERILQAFERDNARAVAAFARSHERTQRAMLATTGVAMLLIVFVGFRVRRRIRRDHVALQTELIQRQRVEARLRETQIGLEAAVARRTAELEEASERLEAAQRIAGAGYWEWNIRDDRLQWSANVFELLGLDPERTEAGFEAYLHAVHPEDRTRVRRTINQALASEPLYRVEHRVVRSDGGVRELRVEGEIERDAAGRPLEVLGMVRDITREKASQERLWHQAHHDSLTGLSNRSLLHEHLAQALRRAERNTGRVALVVCDLDGFKPINDRMGHDAGDVVLVAVAQRLREGVRESDVVARVGGDEFVLLLENVQDSGAVYGICLKLIDLFEEPVEVNYESVRIGLSLGAAIYPEDGDDADTLLQRADRAMYRSKQEGGSRVTLFAELDEGTRHGHGRDGRGRAPLGCGLQADPPRTGTGD